MSERGSTVKDDEERFKRASISGRRVGGTSDDSVINRTSSNANPMSSAKETFFFPIFASELYVGMDEGFVVQPS